MKNSFFTRLIAVGALCGAFATSAQAQTLHLVTVGNPSAFSRYAQSAVLRDVKNVREFFAANVPAGRLRVVDLSDPSGADVQAALGNLAVEPDDVVVFYFTGNAGNQTESGGHAFQFFQGADKKETRLLRRDVRHTLAQKKPRLFVLLTDCCNAYIDALPPASNDGQVKLADGAAQTQTSETDGAKEVSPVARKLFFEPSGCVDITSSKYGQYSFAGDGKTGSLATLAWLDVFEKTNETLKSAPETAVDWRQVSEQMIAETEKRFQAQYPEGDPSFGQATQTPHVFELPGAPRLGARVQTRQRDLIVTEIVKGSPAAQAGLKVGDKLLAIRLLADDEAKRLVDETDYVETIARAPRDVEITVERTIGKKSVESILAVELAGAPSTPTKELSAPSKPTKPETTDDSAATPTQAQDAPAAPAPTQARRSQTRQNQNQAQDAPAAPAPTQARRSQTRQNQNQTRQTQANPDGPVFGATVQGQEIIAVVPNSPAALAGLQVGDKILTFNDATINTGYDYRDAVDASPVDAKLAVLRQANGAHELVYVRLNKNASQPTQTQEPQADPNGPVFGATVRGQEIIAVVPNSPASIAGLQVGEKILTFCGETIENAQNYSDAVDKSPDEAFLQVQGFDGAVRTVIVELNRK